MRILLAEDDAATRLMIQRVLVKEGFEVVLARDGQEALECFSQAPPEIVITDFQMPRMDGVQLCRALKVVRGDRFIPIIMLTGGQDSELLHNSLQAGALEFLSKPVKVDELVARVAAIASMVDMQLALAEKQQETLGEIAVIKHILESLTTPGLKQMPDCFSMETLQTQRINGDACWYMRGIGGVHFGLLCDPTGHGLVAGVSTLPVLAAFQAMANRDIPLESIYREINTKLCRLMTRDRFTCLIMLRVDPEIGLLRVLNAGMPDVFLYRKEGGGFRSFPSRNFPAGILENPEVIEVEDVSIAPGDRIFACSDGLLDLFPESILQDSFLRRGTRYPVAEDHALIRSTISRSLGNAEQHDDLSWALWEVPLPTPMAINQPVLDINPGSREGLILQFEMDPRIHHVRDLVPNILGLLGFKGVPPTALQSLGVLLTEGFINAVDHGLLALDSSQKARGFEAYEACRKEAISRFAGGMARCRLSLNYVGGGQPSLHLIKVEIADDGPGFDWKALLEPKDLDLYLPHGRGIPLMKALSSDFRFNEPGNAVSFSLVL